MSGKSFFAAPGQWLRGNLHTHTNLSDGQGSIEETISLYKNGGFVFLAITDHEIHHEGGNEDGMILFSGIEYNFIDSDTGVHQHIVGLNQRENRTLPQSSTAQDAINMIRETGGEAFLAHPYFLGQTIKDLLPLTGYLGVEVWNTTCFWLGKPLSSVHLDDLLAAGRFPLVLAVDDKHGDRDLYGGWVMVRSKSRTPRAIMAALRAGHFHSTQGPEILNISVNESQVLVECSPAYSVNFLSNLYCSHRVTAEEGPLIRIIHKLPERATYLRIEVEDYAGKVAWCNPVKLP